MPDFDYSTLLPLIDVLLNGTPTDAYVRTAANRAYYSAYGTLRQRIVTEFGSDCFDKQGCHGLLISTCRDPSNSSNLKTIGAALSTLLALRETADYFWSDDITVSQVKTAKTSAGRLVSKIKFLTAAELSIIYNAIQSRQRHN